MIYSLIAFGHLCSKTLKHVLQPDDEYFIVGKGQSSGKRASQPVKKGSKHQHVEAAVILDPTNPILPVSSEDGADKSVEAAITDNASDEGILWASRVY